MVTVSPPCNWRVPLLTKVEASKLLPSMSRVAPESIVRVPSIPTLWVENETTPDVFLISKFSKLGWVLLSKAIIVWSLVPLNITFVDPSGPVYSLLFAALRV